MKKTLLINTDKFLNIKIEQPIDENSIVYHIGTSLTDSHPGGRYPYYIYGDKKSYCEKKNYKYFSSMKKCKEWADELTR